MPKTISKKDIKEAVVEALTPFAKAVQADFEGVNGRFDKVDGRLDGVDSRLDKVDGRLDRIESRLDTVESDLREVKSDVQWMKENSSALFTKLDEFIALYKKQEEELLFLGEQVHRLEERVAKLEAERKK